MISFALARPLRAILPFAFVLVAAQASAQNAPAQPAQGSVALQTQPASKSHLDAAAELMSQVGASKMFDAFIPNMQSQITGLVTRTRPELLNDLKGAISEVQPEFEKQKEQLLQSAVQIFARAMTEQEIKETLVFIKTPTGQKFLDMQGQAVNSIVVMLDQWSKQMAVDMFARVREVMKKKGHEL